MGMTAYGTGLALLPGAIATAVAMPIVPRLMRIIDTRWLLTLGALLFAWSCWALGGLNDVAGYWDVTGRASSKGRDSVCSSSR